MGAFISSSQTSALNQASGINNIKIVFLNNMKKKKDIILLLHNILHKFNIKICKKETWTHRILFKVSLNLIKRFKVLLFKSTNYKQNNPRGSYNSSYNHTYRMNRLKLWYKSLRQLSTQPQTYGAIQVLQRIFQLNIFYEVLNFQLKYFK